ncbi:MULTISPECIES: GNAT family N-acetyltransferase [Paenibacillus]|uniref:GNAT family N-acetyltransferase n=1 Tax=Paenibacillus TaxID=44249 RepID=UPI0022B869B3|nr:GNAT family N-acyltransferase [Paenibacillus caseinilyticus]MCZ8521495.1 GNAT family N-acetyltransferase [Paenibacillus caseinilyticus]
MSREAGGAAREQAALTVRLAGEREREQAYRLRYNVFVEEEKNMLMRTEHGLEMDAYDAYCDHLVVVDETDGQVVGTYRLLPGRQAMDGIGFYSETEFDLGAFTLDRTQTLELGRSCIHPDYRSGRTIGLLWEGIASYIMQHGLLYLIGCASVHIRTIEETNLIYTMLKRKGVLTDHLGVTPLASHRIQGLRTVETDLGESEIFRMLPPLMKGYQRLGAEIGGDPAYDAVFGTVDFFIVLQKDRVTRRYRSHYFKG